MQSSHHDIQNKNLTFNSIQDGLFGGCLRIEGAKKPPSLEFVTHILQWWNLAQLYLT